NKDKKNRLMQIDELHKFSDATLNDVRNALDDRLKGVQMQYFPSTIWRKGDKDRAAAMIQAIEKMLKTRRIMRSLEKFVGGKLDIHQISVEVLRYDKKEKSKKLGRVPTEMELILEHTQQGLESVEARLLVYKLNESVLEENIKLLNIEVQLRDIALATLRQKLKTTEKERDDLNMKLEKF
nr:hypothetical protein [Tanacetum cinerariifolium]